MRARRPALFSDSKIVSEPQLKREVFEYHLSSLTNRKQEFEFEHFCRKLAERVICPNLITQTGPTGGGDSKVDAETYPVSDAISLIWYEGVGREAARERWAFAFSAKKNWPAKVKADAKAIADTKRGYKLIYFVTNQFVPDKRRANTEQRLSEETGIETRILDRTWIVTTVFERELIQLAVEALRLTSHEQKAHKIAGPVDTEREQQLQELDTHIATPDRYRGVMYQLAEDCLQSALLARGLEKPPHEVLGRLARADQIALQVGHRQQRLRVAYNKAWTSFWWYDDFAALNALYDDVERLAVGTSQVDDLQLLLNLWQLLRPTADRGQLTHEAARVDQRAATLKAELQRFATMTDRPTAALEAQCNLLVLRLSDALRQEDKAEITAVLRGLKKALRAAKPLLNFDVHALSELLQELGNVLIDTPAYDDLFETLIDLLNQRASDGAAGESLLERGFQKLRGGKTYDAIRLFGRAQQKLALHEFRSEHITALIGCSLAYEQSGLLWAARANMLVAASQALVPFCTEGSVDSQMLRCMQRLVWLEIQLGRVFPVLACMEVASAIAGALVLDQERHDKYLEEAKTQDIILGLLMLKADLQQLRAIGLLPNLLERQDLPHAWVALMYALGHEEALVSGQWLPASESSDSRRDFFWKWRNQPADSDLPQKPEFYIDTSITLRSVVLGCEIVVHATKSVLSIALAETVLAAIEAFLSTSLDSRIFPYRQSFHIYVKQSDDLDGPPKVEAKTMDGMPAVEILHPTEIADGAVQKIKASDDWLLQVYATVLTQIALIPNAEQYFQRLAREESAFKRVFAYRSLANCTRNIFGNKPKVFVADFSSDLSAQHFELVRTQEWSAGLGDQRQAAEAKSREPLKFGSGEPPPELLSAEGIKHNQQRVLSLIDIPLWDKAQWRGAAYLSMPTVDDAPPILALGFENADAAKSIFAQWRKQFGDVDEKRRLRITILTGVDRKHPAYYKIIIGANLDQIEEKSGERLIMASRIKLFDVDSRKNLDRFLEDFERKQRFILAPAHLSGAEPDVFIHDGIGQYQLFVRPAWQVGRHDVDCMGIQPDDDPIIPDDQVRDAPVLQVLERRKKAGRR